MSVKRIDREPTSQWVEFYQVASHSNPSKSYTVAKSSMGTWGCGCPRWIYKREDCKHIREVLAQVGRGEVETIKPTPEVAQQIDRYLSSRARTLELPDEPGEINTKGVARHAGRRAKQLEM